MTRRNGITLVEVLVAIFVMGLGMIALLTLFPLGALRMAQAIKDDRTGHSAGDAAAANMIWNIKGDLYLWDPDPTNTNNKYTNPDTVTVPGNPPNTPTPITTVGAKSYPIYIDPIGQYAYSATPGTATTIANVPGGIRRYAPRFATPPRPATAPAVISVQTSFRWFSLIDDFRFLDTGVPDPLLLRDGKYSWAYMCRMISIPALINATPDFIDTTIVIYSGRSLSLNAALGVAGETQYPNTAFNTGNNTVRITYAAGNKPSIRRGGWVLDDSMPSPSNPSGPPSPQGYFYRVVNVTDTGPTTMSLEVTRPVGSPGLRWGGTGSVVIMDNVAEVIERGPY